MHCYCNTAFVHVAGYNRGSYNQNRWGSSYSSYRDGGSDPRSGYNRSQQSGGSYNRPAPYKGGYNQVLSMTFDLQCDKIKHRKKVPYFPHLKAFNFFQTTAVCLKHGLILNSKRF